jgi:hypothetical protein
VFLGVLDGLNLQNSDSLLLAVHLSCKNSKQTTPKDDQNHFGQLAEKGQTVAKKF